MTPEFSHEHVLTVADLLLLADPSCMECYGSGCGIERKTCDCISRRIFNACFDRYRTISPFTSGIRLDTIYLSRPGEEYRADFANVARRALNGLPELAQVFRAYVETEGDALECIMALNMSQGAFFRNLVQVKRILAGAFCEVEPYALFPPSRYFRPMRAA